MLNILWFNTMYGKISTIDIWHVRANPSSYAKKRETNGGSGRSAMNTDTPKVENIFAWKVEIAQKYVKRIAVIDSYSRKFVPNK